MTTTEPDPTVPDPVAYYRAWLNYQNPAFELAQTQITQWIDSSFRVEG